MNHKHMAFDTDEKFIIDSATRAISNSREKPFQLIQHDHNAEKFSFVCDRYVEGHELMKWILTNKKATLVNRYKELRNYILSEGNLLLLFSNFMCQIPQAAYAMESVIWPQMPGTMTNNISQIMNHMRLRLEWLDAEIDSL